MKGKTKWFPNRMRPVRNGVYECIVRFGGGQFLWMLKFDGVGFLVPFPMQVVQWRGQTKKAAAGEAT